MLCWNASEVNNRSANLALAVSLPELPTANLIPLTLTGFGDLASSFRELARLSGFYVQYSGHPVLSLSNVCTILKLRVQPNVFRSLYLSCANANSCLETAGRSTKSPPATLLSSSGCQSLGLPIPSSIPLMTAGSLIFVRFHGQSAGWRCLTSASAPPPSADHSFRLQRLLGCTRRDHIILTSVKIRDHHWDHHQRPSSALITVHFRTLLLFLYITDGVIYISNSGFWACLFILMPQKLRI